MVYLCNQTNMYNCASIKLYAYGFGEHNRTSFQSAYRANDSRDTALLKVSGPCVETSCVFFSINVS